MHGKRKTAMRHVSALILVFLFLFFAAAPAGSETHAYETATGVESLGGVSLQFLRRAFDMSEADITCTGKLVYMDDVTIYRNNKGTQTELLRHSICANINTKAGLNKVSGTATLVYPEMATDSKGNVYSVKITVSNVRIYAAKAGKGPYPVVYNISSGGAISGIGFTSFCANYENCGDAETYYYGGQADCTIEVIGAPEGAVFVWAGQDLDVSDKVEYAKTGNKTAYAADGSEPYPYQESVRLLSGVKSEIYRTENTLVRTNADQTAFFGSQEDSNTRNSAIYLLADTGGFSFRWTGSQCGTLMVPALSLYVLDARIEGDYPEGGTITDEGSTTVGWHFSKEYTAEAKEEYYIDRITVDGEEIPVTDTSVMTYTFDTITADHEIVVEFGRDMDDAALTIVKHIRKDEIVLEHGCPTFPFTIEGVTWEDEPRAYHVLLRFSEEEISQADGEWLSKSITIPVTRGVYNVSETDVLRYTFEELAVTNGSIEGETAVFNLMEQSEGTAEFTNRYERNDDFSHNDAVINHINGQEGGE